MRTGLCDTGAKVIGVIALISEQVFERKIADQVFSLEDVMQLACFRMKRTGLPRASTPMLIFVLRPPRLTPDRLIFAPPLFCSGRMLMSNLELRRVANYFVPASIIRGFIPAEYRF